MRIGKTIIDTDNMTIDEMNLIINELTSICERKEIARNLKQSLHNLFEEANYEGMVFCHHRTGEVLTLENIFIQDDIDGVIHGCEIDA